MKRTAVTVLMLAVLLCACAPAPAPETPARPAATASPTIAETVPAALPVPSPMPIETVRAREYGETRMLFTDGNGFTGTLRYPLGDVEPVNRAVTDWAGETLSALETRAAALPADEDGMRLVMEIDYDAYLYENRFVGILFAGTGRETVSGNIERIVYAYNYDLAASRALTLSDVVEQTRMDAVRDLVAQRLAWLDATPLSGNHALTAADMQAFVLRDDGIEWLLAGPDGTTGVLLDYASLAPYLCMEALPTREAAPALDAENAAIETRATCLYDGVQIRALPSRTEGATLTTVNAGDTLDILDTYGIKGWYAVLYEGRTAYVPADLMQLADADPAYTVGYVKSAYLHVRARATTQSELLGTMQYREPVRLIDTNEIDGWYKIWYEGQIAYVSARYVSTDRYPPETQTASFAVTPEEETGTPPIVRRTTAAIVGVGACTTEGVVIRSAPNGRASAYGTLAEGEQVYIMEAMCAQGWDRIFVYTEWNSGFVGYVRACYVDSRVPTGTTVP